MRFRLAVATGIAGACIACLCVASCSDLNETGTCLDTLSCTLNCEDGNFLDHDGSVCEACSKRGADGQWRYPDGRVDEWSARHNADCADAGTGGEAGAAGTGGAGGTSGAGGSGGIDQDAGDAETGGSAGEDAGDAEAGDDAEAEPYCNPTLMPDEDPCVIHDEYGIFVSPDGSDATGCGTKASPCATLAQAMTNAKADSKRVYACGDGGSYGESITIDTNLDGISVFGGFRCADWSYTPSTVRTHVKPAGAQTALVADGLTAFEIRDFAFESGNATDASASSIAAIVRNASGVVFVNTTFTAGDGAAGTDGTNGASAEQVPVVDPTPGQQGGSHSTCGSGTPNGGGVWLTAHQCAAGGTTQGGKGGDSGFAVDGSPGQPGTDTANAQTPGMGQGGIGGTATDKAGKPGETGSPGNPGTNGTAAPTGGNLTASGYSPANGADGSHGWPGQGGGGAGASWSKSGCVGPSGGAGGLGGCGGFAATKGTGGGASIALLVWDSGVTLQDCTLTSAAAGNGGNGGNGGAASVGQLGANGGDALHLDMEDAGKGGTGGNGGPGGSGSGGTGGPSYALAYHGTAPNEQGSVVLAPGSLGAKGLGGQAPGGTKAPDGTDGESAQRYEVP